MLVPSPYRCRMRVKRFKHCVCRKYLPVLKGYPTKYIYEPWTAPEEMQRAARCVIGRDYPMPMVNHAEISQVNMERMKQVYHQISLKSGKSQRGL